MELILVGVLFGVLLMGFAAFVFAAAINDWDWFMKAPNAYWLVTIFGRQGARLIYGVLGCILFLFGLFGTVLGVLIHLSR